MVKVVIDGQEVLVSKGSSVLEACKEVGIDIPRFCFHEQLSIAGNCRMCLVEIEKSPKPVASCAMPVIPNMVIFTESPLVKKSRENVLETLLLNHPLDCPICDQGGECDLQDQVRLFGSDSSRFYMVKRTVEDKFCGPLIKTIMTRCIHCTRCVRFATEIAGVDILGTLNRGGSTEIGTYLERVFDTEISGNVIDLCPVGALTSKPYSFAARPWELRTVECIDLNDSLGSNLYVDFKESEIMRILPRNNEFLNQDWISDKARFSYDSARSQRIHDIFLKNPSNPKFSTLDWNTALNLLKNSFSSSNLLVVIEPNLDLESLYYLSKLKSFSNVRIRFVNSTIEKDLSFETFLQDIELSDCCFFLGINVRLESSILNIRIRNQWQKGNYFLYSFGIPFKSNIPLNFLSLNLKSFIDIFSGKLSFQRDISFFRAPFFLLGESFLNRIDSHIALSSLKTLNENSNFLKLNSMPNNPSASLSGVSSLSSSDLKWANGIFGMNLNDTTSVRKLFLTFQGFKIWGNSYGNSLAFSSNFILPVSVPFECEGIFLNCENRPQKSYKVLNSLGKSRSSKLLSKFFYSLFFKKGFHNHEFLEERLPFLSLLENDFSFFQITGFFFPKFSKFSFFGKSILESSPLKSNLEDFYLANSSGKFSQIMGACSQSVRQRFVNFQ